MTSRDVKLQGLEADAALSFTISLTLSVFAVTSLMHSRRKIEEAQGFTSAELLAVNASLYMGFTLGMKGALHLTASEVK